MYTLNRTSYSEDGVFGLLISDSGQTFYTLEHSYKQADNSFKPKLSLGTYTCQRHAPNRLPYETFEVMNVPDFMGNSVTGILLHIGNYNKDSDGCILVGTGQAEAMITNSREAFKEFMDSLEGTDSFELIIK